MTPTIPILWPSNSIPSARIWREVERWRDPRCRIPAPLHLSSPATGQKCHSFTLGFKSDTVLFHLSKVTQFYTTAPPSSTDNEPYRCSPNLLGSHLVWSRFAGEFYQVEFLSNWSCSYNFQWDIIYKIQIKIFTGNHFPWSMAEDQVKAFGTKIASQFSSKETNNNNNNTIS